MGSSACRDRRTPRVRPCPPWKFCTEPYCEPSSRRPTQLAAQIGAPPLSPITQRLEDQRGNDVSDQVARIARRPLLRIEDGAERRFVRDRRDAALVVGGIRIEQALQRADRMSVAVVGAAVIE